MRKSLIAVAAFACLSTAAIAAPNSDDRMALEVPYADLNLDHPAGAQVMLQRIKFAAQRVCGGRPDMVDLRGFTLFKRCFHAAMDNAVAQLNAPLVTALYNGRAPGDPRFASR